MCNTTSTPANLVKIHTLILLGFLLRVAVAIWNGFWGPSFGADMDALAFHEYAARSAIGEIGDKDYLVGWIYANLLGKVYYIVGESLFLGSLLSCIAWYIGSMVLLRITALLAIPKRNVILIFALYALLPGSILITSVTLREAYQMLFLNAMLLAGLHLIYRFRLRYFVFFLLSAFGASMLHSVFAAYAALSIASIYLIPSCFAGASKKRLFIMLPVAGLFGLMLFGAIGYNLESGLALAVSSYREGALLDARADYSSDVSIANLTDLLSQFPYMMFQYLFEPLPWKMSSTMDVYVLFENMLRLYLLVKAIALIRTEHRPRLAFAFLFANYLLLEAIWALGTNNWGTALRHHLPILGCLLIIGLGGRRIAVRRTRIADISRSAPI